MLVWVVYATVSDCTNRIGGLDWEFSNVTANSAYQFVKPGSSALNETEYADDKTFELRGMLIWMRVYALVLTKLVTNWGYG